MRNARVLELVADPAFQTELGQFNLEINVAPRQLTGGGLGELEEQVRDEPERADERAAHGRRAPGHDRDPADALPRHADASTRCQREPALRRC